MGGYTYIYINTYMYTHAFPYEFLRTTISAWSAAGRGVPPARAAQTRLYKQLVTYMYIYTYSVCVYLYCWAGRSSALTNASWARRTSALTNSRRESQVCSAMGSLSRDSSRLVVREVVAN